MPSSTTVSNAASLTSGWYVFVACGIGVVTAGTVAAPYVTGLLGLALIYQLSLLLQGK